MLCAIDLSFTVALVRVSPTVTDSAALTNRVFMKSIASKSVIESSVIIRGTYFSFSTESPIDMTSSRATEITRRTKERYS